MHHQLLEAALGYSIRAEDMIPVLERPARATQPTVIISPFGSHYLRDLTEPLLIAAVLALVIRTFIFGPYKIPTGSMKPTFMEEDKIFVEKVSYRFHEPARGDIIVFKYPLDRKKDFVKRLIGLPGDSIEIREGVVLINGKPLTDAPFSLNHYYNVEEWKYGKSGQIIKVPPGSYFALGDNSAHSADSRQWGFIPRKDIIGKAVMIWWPPKRIHLPH